MNKWIIGICLGVIGYVLIITQVTKLQMQKDRENVYHKQCTVTECYNMYGEIISEEILKCPTPSQN